MALDINGYNATFKAFTDFAQAKVDAGQNKAIARASQVCHFLFRECPFDPIDMRHFSSSPHNFRLHHQKTDIDDFSPVSSPFLYAWGVTFTPNALRIAPISSPSTSSI